MRRALPGSGALERRLFLTVVVALLPLAALAFITLFQSAQRQKQELLETSAGTMRAIMSAIDADIDASIASLDALAASPRLARGDFTALHAEARQLLARRPSWLNIVVTDRSAQQVMNAHLQLGSPLPRRIDAEGVAEAVRTGRAGVGNIVYSPVLNTHAFAVRVPIIREGAVVYVLTAVVRPQRIHDLLRGQHVPENGVVGVVDRNYRIVARTLNHAESVGKPAAAGFIELLERGETSGWALSTTLEGLPVYTAYYRSPQSGWSAGVGIPTAALDAPTRRSYAVLGGLIFASLVLGVLAALLAGRAITHPMRELKRAADAMGSGAPPVMPHTDLPEIREVASALRTAHAEREALLAAEREARMFAERASRMKDEFLAMLGHELRNPLAAISSASLVLERARTNPAAKAAMEQSTAIIRRQVLHLARLTDDLLDAGRVVTGRIQLERHPLDLAAAVQGTLDTLRSTHRLADHSITTSLSPVWVQGDPTRIDQIVANLLTNAVKYTPSPGTIHVVVERDGNSAVLRIRDSGIGIEPELMPRIFDLFVQGERALDRSLGGLGIGLTLVRRLAELHGGDVAASSPGAGQGSEFTVRLPAVQPLRTPVSPTAGNTPDGPSRRIVVIEDNEDVRASLRQVLQMAGHHVYEAGDGKSGAELILQEQPDIAFIDVGLPVLDGYAVARAVRAAPTARHTRLIAITGYGNPEDIEAGRRAGFDDYLVKPVDVARLERIINDAAGNTVAG